MPVVNANQHVPDVGLGSTMASLHHMQPVATVFAPPFGNLRAAESIQGAVDQIAVFQARGGDFLAPPPDITIRIVGADIEKEIVRRKMTARCREAQRLCGVGHIFFDVLQILRAWIRLGGDELPAPQSARGLFCQSEGNFVDFLIG